jgi:hypothetical protein
MTFTRKDIGLVLMIAALVFAPTVAAQLRAQGAPGGFADLVGALKATPGCLGVEAARTASGKQVLFAWFENKKALLAWYYSDTHQGVMNQFFPGRPERTPLVDIPDDGAPVLAIASVTMTDKPTGVAGSMPIAQIAIELYRPLPGGIAVGGRFAPANLPVPGLRDLPSAAGAAR